MGFCHFCYNYRSVYMLHAPHFVVFMHKSESKFKTNMASIKNACHVFNTAISLPTFCLCMYVCICISMYVLIFVWMKCWWSFKWDKGILYLAAIFKFYIWQPYSIFSIFLHILQIAAIFVFFSCIPQTFEIVHTFLYIRLIQISRNY